MNRRVNTLIIGGGIAGLFAALRASEHGSVVLATKTRLNESNTRYAQGGIAAVMFDDDSVESHIADTLAAGAGLCNEIAVRILCSEGPQRIRDLLAIGVAFDRSGDNLARGLEAAHSSARVLHAGGDATGAAVQTALETAARERGIEILEHAFLTDLVSSPSTVRGARFLLPNNEVTTVYADATILATGGAGQIYEFTTNPPVATGDGVAAAFRAGAAIADAEMYQFHPTLMIGALPFLVSEAVRGEGAVLRNRKGERFMVAHHPLAELAPRDVVARSIAEEMALQDGEPVVLDATALDADFLAARFPTIDAHCRDAGIDWSTTMVPVSPAAHFWMGGVLTDTWGCTSLEGLYAIGEVACTGVHGANRLASNSLLEGLVFADRAVRHIAGEVTSETSPDDESTALWAQTERALVSFTAGSALHGEPSRHDIKQLTWEHLGLARNEHGLRVAAKQLAVWANDFPAPVSVDEWEVANMLTISQLIATAALKRTESRGAHFRTDFAFLDESQRHHIVLQRQP